MKDRRIGFWLLTLTWGVCQAWALAAAAAESRNTPAAVDYNRQIRPLLANHCYQCHGPDHATRKAGLRLDVRAAAIGRGDSGEVAIVPGKPHSSELISRITSTDESLRMPPPDAQKPLSAADKELIARWIAEGAEFETHWAFSPPQRPAVPAVKDRDWPRNVIDYFVLARQEASGLTPSPVADRAILVRRLKLDLTGLPPTPAEVDAFLADDRPDAYERLVDRLLASPNFGERLAVDWLDAARFADTHGYHIDSGRDMTRWREYVIGAFNRNLPYDQFTVEQLAGDLLPETSDPQQNLRQKLASGFNRNHMINFEGGAIAQEYLTAYIVDRVNTTGTVFLGLTVGCSQCHDHKFDPLTQREFYQLYAFFNNVPENGLDGAQGNAAPLMKAPRPAQQHELHSLAAEIAAAERQLLEARADVDIAQQAWEQQALVRRKTAWIALDLDKAVSAGGATLTAQADQSLLVSGSNPATDTYEVSASSELKSITGIRLEALPHDSLVNKGPGRSVNGNIVLTEVQLLVRGAGGDSKTVRAAFKAASADFSQETFPIAHAIDGNRATGWAIHPRMGQSHAAVFELEQPLAMTDGSQLTINLLFQSGFAQHQLGHFRLAATSASNPHTADSLPMDIATALAVPAASRTPEQQQQLVRYYREHVSPETAELRNRLEKLKERQTELEKLVPTAMVMQDLPQMRETRVLERGAYDKPGEAVTADTPAFLPPLGTGPRNRLGLAGWLVDPGHPLLSRVTVNRYWQLFFGLGIVKTAEDFGTQGELPSHPELLDWLAVDFSDSDSRLSAPREAWNVKRLVRQIVTSATYRQSSSATPEAFVRDAENRLLARGPRFRLQAEFIRDQALLAAGLLDPRIGGHSVSPYQPAGIWEELASRADGKKWTAQTYTPSHGQDLYRRTMYTFWKRTAPPPSLLTFDAPDRETCTVRRSRTNTPLQALVLMNDPTYVEAARKFAERVVHSGGQSVDERLTFAFRTVLSRLPTKAELSILQGVFQRQREMYQRDPEAAEALLSVGESTRDTGLPVAELAAWTVVASALLNTDEALTKG